MEMWLNFYVSDEVVCKSYGECWLSYFFRMRRYGLSHIWDEMHEQLSTDLRSDESSRPVERDRCDSWVPFSQWRSVFWQWARGQITAGDVRVQYGEAWLSLFTRVSTFGLEPYREELAVCGCKGFSAFHDVDSVAWDSCATEKGVQKNP